VTDLDRLDRVRREYIDKYVVVDAKRPELARFGDVVGQVKTVNMNGRALVEFLDYHCNTGWHDIELDYLKVVDPPASKKEPVRGAAEDSAKKRPVAASAKAPVAKRLSPLEMARQQGPAGKKTAAKSRPEGGKSPVADILAAARGQAPAEKGTPPSEGTGETASPAAPSGGTPPRGKKRPPKSGERKSVADILATARAQNQATEGTAATPPSAPSAPAKDPPEERPSDATPREAKPAGGTTPRKSVADILAAARAEEQRHTPPEDQPRTDETGASDSSTGP
jgi:hypothetical protein